MIALIILGVVIGILYIAANIQSDKLKAYIDDVEAIQGTEAVEIAYIIKQKKPFAAYYFTDTDAIMAQAEQAMRRGHDYKIFGNLIVVTGCSNKSLKENKQ